MVEKQICIKLTEKELEKIRSKARDSRRSINNYILYKILGEKEIEE